MRNSLLGPNSDLRVLVVGGERCPAGSVLRSWKADGNKTRLINIYGVTEVSCWATWYEITRNDLQLSHIASFDYGFVLDVASFKKCLQCFDAVDWAAGRASGL